MDRLHHLLARAQLPSRAPRPRTLLTTTTLSALLLAFLTWCYRDYRAYLALGPGGPPHNLLGWAAITVLARPFALRASATTSTHDYPAAGAHACIAALPARRGPRARVGGVAPHRQLSQRAPERMRAPVRALFAGAAAANAAAVEMRTSLYERHNEALFVRGELLSASEDGGGGGGGGEKVPRTAVVARGEIGHAHGDLSVHVYVAPADARVLIEKGWAERHRLAVPRGAWWGAERYHVGDTFLMVYGPRDEGELEVLRTILVNAMRFMTGREDVRMPEWREG